VEQVKVLDYPVSDHLPIAMEITLPDALRLTE
jgi:endonuclease/exonuclease/phosphatase family metal-dependent hydrolase